MKRNAFISGFMGLVVAVSFAAGLFDRQVRAQGGFAEGWSILRPQGDGRELDPIKTYNQVLQLVNERYYGEDIPTPRRMTYHAVRGLLASLDDPYTRFLDPDQYKKLREDNEGAFEGIGAKLDGAPTKEGYIRVSRPMPGGPADKAGLKRGDLITKVDGVSVVGLEVDQAVDKIRGRAGTTVHLGVLRGADKKPVDVAIVRAPVQYDVVEHRMLEGNVGYVSLQQFNEIADRKITEAVDEMEAKGMKALILDLRGNPGGLLDAAIDVSSRFVNPGRGVVWIVEAGGERDLRKTNDRIKPLLTGRPLVLLVNRTSASASEIVSGAIKDNKAGTIVGTTTFGKGLVQTVVPLEDGSACMITTAKYLTPSGKDINRSRDQRGGVEPDVTVEVTEDQWEKGEDPQLAKALQLLQEKIGYHPAPKPAAASANTAAAR